MKSMNIDLWVLCTLNKLFIRGSFTEIKFQKNKVVSGETPLTVTGPFCTPHWLLMRQFLWK